MRIWQLIKGLFAKKKRKSYRVLILHCVGHREMVTAARSRKQGVHAAIRVAKRHPEKRVVVTDQEGNVEYIAYGQAYVGAGDEPLIHVPPKSIG